MRIYWPGAEYIHIVHLNTEAEIIVHENEWFYVNIELSLETGGNNKVKNCCCREQTLAELSSLSHANH